LYLIFIAFTSFEKQYQMNFNVTDMETENIFEQRNFNQECEDDGKYIYFIYKYIYL